MITIKTAQQILAVVKKHVGQEKMDAILKDLRDIPGNKSFRDTIEMLSKLYGSKIE